MGISQRVISGVKRDVCGETLYRQNVGIVINSATMFPLLSAKHLQCLQRMTFDPNFILLTMIRQSQMFLCIYKNQGLTEYTQFSNLKVKFISKNHCVSYPLTFSLRLKKKSSRSVLYISRKHNKYVWCVFLIVQNKLSNRLTNLFLLRGLKKQ